MNLPLSGIKVVEFSNYVAAPSTGRLLCDMGAEVIKIEAFGGDAWRDTSNFFIGKGDEESPVYDSLNWGKQSICLDLKTEKGKEILMRMLADADIFLTNTRAKSLLKLGLDGETLIKKFPRLIYASLDGYGTKGPEADTPGFDGQAFWTRSGYLLDMSEEGAGYPDFSPSSVGDCVTGGFLMAGIMTALYNREKTGHGDVVHTSLYGSAIWVMNTMIIKAQEKYGKHSSPSRKTINPLTANFMCKDGEWFRLGVINYTRDAGKVYDLLGISKKVLELGIVDYATKTLHNAELLELFQQAFLSRTAAEWEKPFKDADIPCIVMQHFKDVSTDEQALVNHYVEEYRFRNGETCAMPRTPIHIASAPSLPMVPAALPGEQTDDILRAYGYSEEEILTLHGRNVVK